MIIVSLTIAMQVQKAHIHLLASHQLGSPPLGANISQNTHGGREPGLRLLIFL